MLVTGGAGGARIIMGVLFSILGTVDYGLDLPQLVIVNISVPEEVEKAVDARSSMGVIGDMDRYRQYQLGASIPTAAANPGAGVGVGMGMAIAGAATMPSKAPLPLIPPSPESEGAAVWHVASGGKTFGPYSVAQLAEAISSGQLSAESLVWSAGMGAWTPMGRVALLAALLGPPPPPPPPAA